MTRSHSMQAKSPTTIRIPSRLSAGLYERIENWRLAQAVPPSKTATIEYLLDLGLKQAMRARHPGGS